MRLKRARYERRVQIGEQQFVITAERGDEGWYPEATEDGETVYLGGEDDEDANTPEAALAQGEQYIRDRVSRDEDQDTMAGLLKPQDYDSRLEEMYRKIRDGEI